jgi:hypothetical protein
MIKQKMFKHYLHLYERHFFVPKYQNAFPLATELFLSHRYCIRRICVVRLEEFEDTKEVIRIRKSKKDRQHNGQKKSLKIPIVR